MMRCCSEIGFILVFCHEVCLFHPKALRLTSFDLTQRYPDSNYSLQKLLKMRYVAVVILDKNFSSIKKLFAC